MKPFFVRPFWSLLFLTPWLGAVFAQTPPATGFPFVVDVTASNPLEYLPGNGPAYNHLSATVTSTNVATSGTYNYVWTQLQDSQNPYAVNATGSGKSGISGSTSQSAFVAHPVAGVYEYQVVVTDAKNPALAVERRVWVRVWDSKPAFGSDPLMVAPGCAAPTAVTTIHSDPGPYVHPRVLCTPADQAAMHARVTGGSAVASQAFANVVAQNVTPLIGSATVAEDPITKDLLAYMGLPNTAALDAPYTGNYGGNSPTLASDMAIHLITTTTTVTTNGVAAAPKVSTTGHCNFDDYYNLLWGAAYAAWVNPQGAGITLQAVANLSAALAHYHLAQAYTPGTGTAPGVFHSQPIPDTEPTTSVTTTTGNTSTTVVTNYGYYDYIIGLEKIGYACNSDFGLTGGNDLSGLAIAYDFSYNKMSPAQQEDVRKLLFAVGYDRAGTGATPTRGFAANGDFSNLGDFRVFLPLAIAGEEGSVQTIDPQIYTEFSTPAANAPWMTAQNGSFPSDPAGWAFSTGATVGDLQRELWWSIDYYASAWGWTTNREDYYGFSALYLYPASLAIAIHGGENQFVTNNVFVTKELLLWELAGGDKGTTAPAFGLPGKLTTPFTSNQYLYDHHDSSVEDYREVHLIFLKYMYPNDLAIDYIYRQLLPRAFAQGSAGSLYSPLWFAMFGTDPLGLTSGTPTTLAQAGAKEEQGASSGTTQAAGQLIKVDPQNGATVVRSGWNQTDAELYFDTSWQHTGHWHDEQNSFSFFAGNRAWAFSPGRHDTVSDAQSAVLYQDPNYAGDLATSGYRGGSLASATQNVSGLSAFPPSPGKLINVSEDPNHLFATMIGDNSFSQIWACATQNSNAITGFNRVSFMPGGFYGYFRSIFGGINPMSPSQASDFDNRFNVEINQSSFTDGNFAQIRPGFVQARRSIVFVRQPYPYALIVDDFNPDNTKHNYRWFMSSDQGFAPGIECIGPDGQTAAGSVTLLPGTATPAQAVFYHPVDQTSGPRLLVKDCTEAISGMTVPPITLEAKINIADANAINQENTTPTKTSVSPAGVAYLNVGGAGSYFTSNRVLVEHDNVVKPQFKTLLFPFLAASSTAPIGPVTPTTTTTVNGNITTITVNNPVTAAGTAGPVDTITLNAANLNTNPAQYISFSRASSTAKAPTITLPANANLSDAFGAPVNYSGITATNSSGANLPVTYSVPNGTVFMPGETTVTASALDPATGLESSQTFTVTTAPAAPVASIQSIYNADATLADNGITLSWPPVLGATSYNVYRATAASGPFVLSQSHIAPALPNDNAISELTIFNDRGLSGTSYFYHVTAVVTDTSGIDHEGLPSNIIGLNQPVPANLGLTAQGIGHNTNPNSGVGFAPMTTAPFSFLLSQSNQLSKSGYGFPNYYDEGFTFLGKTWTGDGTFTVRLTKEYENYGTATDPNANQDPYYGSAYGLIFRDNAPTTNPGEVAEAGVLFQENVGHSNQAVAYSRPLIPHGNGVGSTGTLITQGAFDVPIWLRLARVGTTFSEAYSTDGVNWTAGQPVTIPMSATTQVGVNVAAGGSTAQDNGTFDNLVFLSPPTITPSNNSLALNWSQSTGATSYSLARANTAKGPFIPIPNATNLTGTSYTDNGLTNLTTYYYQLTARDSTGSVSSVNPVAGIPAVVGTPTLVVSPGNNLITVFWTQVPGATSYTVYQSTNPTSGPYITASNAGSSYTATGLTNGRPYYFFVAASNAQGTGADSATIGSVPVAWTDQNVGTVGTQGTYTSALGKLTVTGSGADVTNSSDSFNYLSRSWTGDGTFIAHLAQISTTDTGPNASAKIGVMFRASPATGTNIQNEFLLDTLNSSALQSRTTTGGNTNSTGGPGAPPNWLRLERSGTNFTAFTSVDETNWLQIGSAAVTNSIIDPGLIGLAVNARNNAAVATAVFDATAFLVIPQNLATSDLEGTHVNVNWSLNSKGNVTDATALQLEISPAGANTWSVVSSTLVPLSGGYEVTGLSPNTSYDFRIKELENGVAGDYATLSGITTKNQDLPGAPSNLAGVIQAQTSVALTWQNNATNANAVTVAYRPTGTTNWITYASSLSPTTTSETVQSLVQGKSYDFEVYATNAAGASLYPDTITVLLPTSATFAQWTTSYGLSGANALPGANPAGDGVSNALKYLIGSNPTSLISTADRDALPVLGTITANSMTYLTLTFRQSAADAAGLTTVLQSSPDLKNWTTESPAGYTKTVGTDPVTHDPLVALGTPMVGSRQFVRLKLTTP